MIHRRIRALGAVAAVTIGTFVLPAHGAGWSGTAQIVLENALPMDGTPRRPNGRQHQDVHITLTCADGAFRNNGWAYVPAMPGVEHPLRVTASRTDGAAAHLVMTVDLRHQLPQFWGGTATYTLDLQLDEGSIRGTYAGKIDTPDAKARLAAWRKLGGDSASVPIAGVRAGETASLLHLARKRPTDPAPRPIAVTGELHAAAPAAKAVDGPLLPVPAKSGAALTAAQVEAAAKDASPGATAAAWAALARAGDKDAAGKALESARAAIAATGKDWRAVEDLAGVAVAYDLAKDAWPADARQQIASHLAAEAIAIAALQEGMHFARNGRIGPVGGAYDPRLAAVRAAAGLAALAVKDDVSGAAAEDVKAALEVSARTVRRYLQTGIGPRGASCGNTGTDEALEIVLPFVQAMRRATGEDLAIETGASWIAAWTIASDGQMLGVAHDNIPTWLHAAAGVAEPSHRAAIAWYAQQNGIAPRTPWQLLLAAMNATTEPPMPPALPLVLHDTGMHAVVARSGWTAMSFVTASELGAGAPEAAFMRGHFSVSGLGRQWIAPVRAPRGTFRWPAASDCNVMQVWQSETTNRGAAEAYGGGKLARVRAGREGMLSVAMTTQGFREAGSEEEIEDTKAWRTLGVDYSGASGAPAVIALVEGTDGLFDRQQVWEIELGDVPADAVKIDGMRFTVAPPGSKATMQGTFLYPSTVHLEYFRPKDSTHGRLRAYRQKPGEHSLEALMKRMDERLDAKIQAMLNDEVNTIEVDKFDLRLEDENVAENERVQRTNEVLYLKLLKETSSVKMGAPDRKGRAKGNLVVIMTIQEGPPPAVRVLDSSDPALVSVGGQKITYREYLLEFSKIGGAK